VAPRTQKGLNKIPPASLLKLAANVMLANNVDPVAVEFKDTDDRAEILEPDIEATLIVVAF
jgi:hypothetical protein